MILWREGRLTTVVREWQGAVEYEADVYDPAAGVWKSCRALAYPELVGRPRPGDLVLLNTTALELGLGTGGEGPNTPVARPPPAGSPRGEEGGDPIGQVGE